MLKQYRNDLEVEKDIMAYKEDKKAVERQIDTCIAIIDEYKEKIENLKLGLSNKLEFLTENLNAYFLTVEHHKTKTTESYQLPSCKLELKQQQPQYDINSGLLVKYLKDNNKSAYLHEYYKPDWKEFKSTQELTVLDGGVVIDKDGQIVEGVTATKRPAKFEVKL